MVAESRKTQEDGSSKWVPPPQGVVKLNTDAALEVKGGRVGWGVVARREDGMVVGAWAGGERRNGIPAVEEALAIREAVIKAKQCGWNKVEIQSDCKQMLDLLTDRNGDHPTAGTILHDVLELCQAFKVCYFSFVKRGGNSVSHKLAKFAISLSEEISWKESFPIWLTSLATLDVRAVAQTM